MAFNTDSITVVPSFEPTTKPGRIVLWEDLQRSSIDAAHANSLGGFAERCSLFADISKKFITETPKPSMGPRAQAAFKQMGLEPNKTLDLRCRGVPDFAPFDTRAPENAHPSSLTFTQVSRNPPLPITYSQFVGFIYLMHPTAENAPAGEVNIGVVVSPAYRGEGCGRQAVELVLKWVFGELGYRRVQAIVLETSPSKEAAIRLFTSLGFAREGTRRRSVVSRVDGTWINATYIAMLDTDWALRDIRPGPRSIWDEMFERHEREQEEIAKWEEGKARRKALQKRSSTETLKGVSGTATTGKFPPVGGFAQGSGNSNQGPLAFESDWDLSASEHESDADSEIGRELALEYGGWNFRGKQQQEEEVVADAFTRNWVLETTGPNAPLLHPSPFSDFGHDASVGPSFFDPDFCNESTSRSPTPAEQESESEGEFLDALENLMHRERPQTASLTAMVASFLQPARASIVGSSSSRRAPGTASEISDATSEYSAPSENRESSPSPPPSSASSEVSRSSSQWHLLETRSSSSLSLSLDSATDDDDDDELSPSTIELCVLKWGTVL
ncbi:hypothetical protein JAAARDRAFT_191555 [Jaapia argillacea MUCL 33604]|uniref:N-acetyltransferase domain-containing protein n=1 Tax=Jaapia argillacea MUCL 33604 TaxID=933084 RepID=A0A067PZL1_9AGAM|nr:hypothetical protein JAAARDRAFT_191555 [Jaapia argillacea MUCL 33604]